MGKWTNTVTNGPRNALIALNVVTEESRRFSSVMSPMMQHHADGGNVCGLDDVTRSIGCEKPVVRTVG